MATLSVCLIAKNEAENISRCLTSIQSVADQIVVVIDPATTDQTEDIAQKFTSDIFSRKFDTFASQRNFALSKCTGDWILSIDCDEEISPKLITEIQALKTANSEKFSVYGLKRLNIIFGKPVEHGNWDPNPINRLWKNGTATWQGSVHETLVFTGSPGILSGDLIHHSYQTISQFISKMNIYTSLETTTQNPLVDFLRRYIWHAGFLDGMSGLILSYLMVIYHTSVWIKTWEKQK